FSAPGETLNYSYAVTNTGNVTLTNVAITDALPGISPVVCQETMLLPGASTTCTATYVATQADVDRGTVNNSAVGTGRTPSDGLVTSPPSETSVPGTADAQTEAVKSAQPAAFTAPGQTLNYSYLVTNTGAVTLTNVAVRDALAGVSPVVCQATRLAPGEL